MCILGKLLPCMVRSHLFFYVIFALIFFCQNSTFAPRRPCLWPCMICCNVHNAVPTEFEWHEGELLWDRAFLCPNLSPCRGDGISMTQCKRDGKRFVCIDPSLYDRSCYPGGHYWDYYPDVLSLIKSLQLIWRSGTHRRQLWVCDLRMRYIGFTTWRCIWIAITVRGYPAKRALSAMRKHGG